MSQDRSDQMTLQSLLALAALPRQDALAKDGSFAPSVFAEVICEDGGDVASRILSGAQGIMARTAVNRILVLRGLVSDVGFCYLQLATFKGVELYIPKVHDLPSELLGM